MNLAGWDLVVIFLYLLFVTGIGLHFFRQKNTEDFFLAGRTMHWFPVSLSVMATNFSAISLMGVPGFIYNNSLQPMIALLISLPLIMPIVICLFLRFFQGKQFTTAYQYLEARFHVSLRTIGAALFILLRLSWLATAIYVPSLALATVTNIPLAVCIAGVGILSTLYTVVGGMKAVIWTDVAQFFIMVIGMTTMVIVILNAFNWDVSEIWSIAASAGRTEMFDFKFDFTKNLSFWGLGLGYVFIMTASYGVDQVVVQRYLSTRNFRQGSLSVVGMVCATIPVLIVLSFLGIGMYAFYHVHPEYIPIGIDLAKNPDKVLPVFVVNQLPVGLCGLMIASIFSATMSSVDSGINSLTTVCMVDFRNRFSADKENNSEKHEKKMLVLARYGTLIWGIFGTLIAFFVKYLGTIIEISGKTNSYFTGVLLGIFLLGVLFKRVNTFGVLTGLILGLATVFIVGLTTSIVFWWYSPIACLSTVIFGLAGSCFRPAPSRNKIAGLTI